MNIQFTQEDKHKIQQMEKKFSEKAKFAITLIDCIDTWKKSVNACKNGDVEFDEYLNDIYCRTIIEDVGQSLSDNSKISLQKFVKPLDKDFIENTVEIDHSLLDALNKDLYFWYYRIPFKMHKDELDLFQSYLDDFNIKERIIIL